MHVHAHGRILRRARVRAYLQRALALFISRILALLQIRKKRGEYTPFRTLAHHIKLLRLLSTFLSSARAFRSYPPPRRREKKIRPRWVVAEIGAAWTSIRNEDGKCAVTTFESFLVYSLYRGAECHHLESRDLHTQRGCERQVLENLS